jgi:hypothetical protein
MKRLSKLKNTKRKPIGVSDTEQDSSGNSDCKNEQEKESEERKDHDENKMV